MRARILLVEDEHNLAVGLKKELEANHYSVQLAECGDTGLSLAKEGGFDLVVTDWKMPGLSGLDLIKQLHLAKPRLPIILITAYGTSQTAIEASKFGALDYLRKPFDMPEMLQKIAQTLNCTQEHANRPGIRPAESVALEPAMLGNSRAMQDLYRSIGLAAATRIPVLIRGETGTGKELVARALHQFGERNRANGPFVAVNCTALQETLLESELFGHERGAFTGAQQQHTGRFEHANGGTLFLDEIGDLTPGSQVKLLRVLQENFIQRVGSNDKIPVNVRVLAATHRDLEAAIRENRFREDLFYRISGVVIHVPPLRDRLEDVPELTRHFLAIGAEQIGIRDPFLEMEALEFLCSQPWPGNVRQLGNVVRNALLFAGAQPISIRHIQTANLQTRSQDQSERHALTAYLIEVLAKAQQQDVGNVHAQVTEEIEQLLFSHAFSMSDCNQARAARLLGVTRTTLREKLNRFGLLRRKSGVISDIMPPRSSILFSTRE
jgi:DNA-binding NtrC family response regulator